MGSGLGTWLLSLSGPIARQVLVALGISVVSFVGFEAGVNMLLGQAKAAWAGMPADVAAYVALSGVNTGLSLIAGAMIGRLSLLPLKQLRLL